MSGSRLIDRIRKIFSGFGPSGLFPGESRNKRTNMGEQEKYPKFLYKRNRTGIIEGILVSSHDQEKNLGPGFVDSPAKCEPISEDKPKKKRGRPPKKKED